YVWYSTAAANGHPCAAQKRDLAAKQLSDTALIEADLLATHYFKHYQPKKPQTRYQHRFLHN
ncbi:MAG: hypothetical protein ACRC9R_04205, partial [Enterovibrio sp.]